MRKTVLSAVVAAGALLALAAQPASARARFGAGCQRDFQNGWQHTLSYVWNRCGWFNNELDDTDTKVFYYNLHNAKWWWEDAGDQYTLDNVHLFYASTHGGAWGNNAVWTMWDQNSVAYSSRMRLGDERYGLSVLATYACHTMQYSDGKLWTRMGPIFRGGLRYAMGSHDVVYDGYTTDETGEDFADNLQKGKPFWYAWKDANSDWWVDNDVAVMATGASSTDCSNRLWGMKWQNFGSYPRLRDGQIHYYCAYAWSNL